MTAQGRLNTQSSARTLGNSGLKIFVFEQYIQNKKSAQREDSCVRIPRVVGGYHHVPAGNTYSVDSHQWCLGSNCKDDDGDITPWHIRRHRLCPHSRDTIILIPIVSSGGDDNQHVSLYQVAFCYIFRELAGRTLAQKLAYHY